MPIAADELYPVLPEIFSPATPVAALLHGFAGLAPELRATHFAVVQAGPGLYAVLSLDDLVEPAREYGRSLLQMSLSEVEDLLQPGAPIYAAQIEPETARRLRDAAPQRRLVTLGEDGSVMGVLALLLISKSPGPLYLLDALRMSISPSRGVVVPSELPPLEDIQLELSDEPLSFDLPEPLEMAAGDTPEAASPPPYLNTRFDGVAPDAPLAVGVYTPLVISIGPQMETSLSRSSRPFDFTFPDAATPVTFKVMVDGDPEYWTIKPVTVQMVVAPPGKTLEEALFLVMAKQPCRDKLHICVEQAASGAVVQHVWLPVTAGDPPADEPFRAMGSVTPPRVVAELPLDAADLERRRVEITVQPGTEAFVVIVRADLPAGSVRETYRLPVSPAEVQNALVRLRQELAKIVTYELQRDGRAVYPFLNNSDLTIDAELARKVVTPLADAGEQVWRMLFGGPRTPAELRQLAADIRDLPEGSSLQVVLDSQQFVMPWALLYDKPGPIKAATLDWAGFWGYRYILDTLPPGRYPAPAIAAAPPGIQAFFNDDRQLEPFTLEQARFLQSELTGAPAVAVWGDDAVQAALATANDATLIYCYCHGDHESASATAGALASESRISFSQGRMLRLADLRRLPAADLKGRPVVFLNACEGATTEAFFYDGFMPFFIEELGARGFIGTEVKAPQLLAHDFGMRFIRAFAAGQPIGAALWRLRRHYLEAHHNILGFAYSLYGLGEVRLAKPVLV